MTIKNSLLKILFITVLTVTFISSNLFAKEISTKDAIKTITDAYKKVKAIQSYTCFMHKKEKVPNTSNPTATKHYDDTDEIMEINWRQFPGSKEGQVIIKFLKSNVSTMGVSREDLQILYPSPNECDKNELQTSLSIPGFGCLDIYGKDANAKSRHPITESSIMNLVTVIGTDLKKADKLKGAKIEDNGVETLQLPALKTKTKSIPAQSIKCLYWSATFPKDKVTIPGKTAAKDVSGSKYYSSKVDIWFEQSSMLPVQVKVWDKNGVLVEEFAFYHIKTNSVDASVFKIK